MKIKTQNRNERSPINFISIMCTKVMSFCSYTKDTFTLKIWKAYKDQINDSFQKYIQLIYPHINLTNNLNNLILKKAVTFKKIFIQNFFILTFTKNETLIIEEKWKIACNSDQDFKK